MPMINGVKFACEPCMRGHRSSKCAHRDRLLVRVRKPGRPLSSCPHTLSAAANGDDHEANAGTKGPGVAACSCEVAVAQLALPKNASCACDPASSAPSNRPRAEELKFDTNSTPAQTAAPPGPQSPTSLTALAAAANGSCRIQKSYHRNRKKSIVDDGKNGVKEDHVWEILKEKEEETNGTAGVNANANGGSYGREYGMFLPSLTGTNGNIGRALEIPNDDIARMIPSLTPTPNPLEVWNGEQRWPTTHTCNSAAAVPTHTPDSAPQHRHHHHSYRHVPKPPCCGGSVKPALYNPMLPQYFPYFHQHVYAHPPGTQTINHPLTPEELAWLQHQRAAGVFGVQGQARVLATPTTPTERVPSIVSRDLLGVHGGCFNGVNGGCSNGVNGGCPNGINGVPRDVRDDANGTTPWQHHCNCGPSCNCLGCAVHPFNPRTTQYAREMGMLMVSSQSPPSAHTPNPAAANNASCCSGVATASVEKPGCCSQQRSQRSPNATPRVSPSQDEDEDERERDREHEDTLSPGAFLYVDYPMAGCDAGGCACGEGCTCVGCLTHGIVSGSGMNRNEIANGIGDEIGSRVGNDSIGNDSMANGSMENDGMGNGDMRNGSINGSLEGALRGGVSGVTSPGMPNSELWSIMDTVQADLEGYW